MLLFYLLFAVINRRDNTEEIKLIRMISDKNQAALAELYDLYSKLLYSIIFKIIKKQEDAEEILQSIFLQVWEKSVTFDFAKGNVFAWLVTIARNKAIDKIRSGSYRKEKNSFYYIEETKIERRPEYSINTDIVMVNEKIHLIQKALSDLPEEQKKVIEMAYFEGYSQSEISEQLSVPLGTVKTRTRQALSKLENSLSLII